MASFWLPYRESIPRPFRSRPGNDWKEGTHDAVEKTVITVGQLLPERFGTLLQPVAESLPYPVHHGVGELHRLGILHADGFVVLIVTDAFGDIRQRIVQGVNEQ